MERTIQRDQEQCECGAKLYWRTRSSKFCYSCDQELEIEDDRTAVQMLEAEFKDGLKYGTQFDAIQNASKLVADEFARNPDFDEVENPEFEEKLAEIEKLFDERQLAYRTNNPVSQACQNFLTAIRQKYVPVKIVKLVTDKLNSRERQLVWSTWKGFSHKVYYPKG